jgi:hypothetical protein
MHVLCLWQLERDVWLWCIQVEMQRLARRDPERILQERNAGMVPMRT